jgi:amidase
LSATDLSVVGPLARDVEDLDIAIGVLAGAAGHAAVGWRLELPPPRATKLHDLRLAFWLDDPAYPVDTEVTAVLDDAATALRGAGAQVVDARPDVVLPDVFRLFQQFLYPILLSTMGKRSFDNMVDFARSLDEDDDRPLARTARFATQRYRDWVFAGEKREKLRALMAEYFVGVDALLMPVAMVSAIAHDHSEPFPDRVIEVNGAERPYTDLMAWVALATLTHLPATVVPVGRTASGLPVGIQIVGPYLEDSTTLAVGRLVEELLGGFVPPPGA